VSREPENRASLDLKVGAERLANAFLRYHFNSMPGAYHGTDTAPFAVVSVCDKIALRVQAVGHIRAEDVA
jgi:hypothetical protein